MASRFGSPLSCGGRQRSFRHKSLQEYFTSLMLLRELSLFGEEKNKLKINDDDDIYFNGRYLIEEPSIQDFLLEMMNSSSFANKFDCDWKKILLGIIESSKTNESMSIACGNSMTLLLLLGHSFVGSDLRNIHCSGGV